MSHFLSNPRFQPLLPSVRGTLWNSSSFAKPFRLPTFLNVFFTFFPPCSLPLEDAATHRSPRGLAVFSPALFSHLLGKTADSPPTAPVPRRPKKVDSRAYHSRFQITIPRLRVPPAAWKSILHSLPYLLLFPPRRSLKYPFLSQTLDLSRSADSQTLY